ncbi:MULTISPECIES: GIY-YIG nuclease family protein [Methylomonas]|uniref:GIY-YIG nuclease family protein n=1 Tax=Methylomonas TaxID=416 RepID=UPI001232ABA0|nr:GIY-YIG nuclease family protein [Methylomonas rhizoryzae]
MSESPKAWSVYIVICSDGALYTGISTDVDRRFRQHASGKGAKFFRTRRPLRIAYIENGYDKSQASRRERAIKRLKSEQKRSLIAQAPVATSIGIAGRRDQAC